MARILCNVAGGGKPLKGNAEPGDVLSGKTFSNKKSNALTGSMPNNGAMNVTLAPSGNNSTSRTVAAGYYSGGTITADGSASYNSGYTDGRNSAHLVTYKGLQADGSIYAILEIDGQQKYKGNSVNTNFTTYIGNTSINIQSGYVNASSIVAHLYINGTEVFNDNIPNIYNYGRSLIVYV